MEFVQQRRHHHLDLLENIFGGGGEHWGIGHFLIRLRLIHEVKSNGSCFFRRSQMGFKAWNSLKG